MVSGTLPPPPLPSTAALSKQPASQSALPSHCVSWFSVSPLRMVAVARQGAETFALQVALFQVLVRFGLCTLCPSFWFSASRKVLSRVRVIYPVRS